MRIVFRYSTADSSVLVGKGLKKIDPQETFKKGDFLFPYVVEHTRAYLDELTCHPPHRLSSL